MGEIASRCLTGCEEGDYEIGDLNLEQYKVKRNFKRINSHKKEDLTGELYLKVKSGNQKMKNFIEENKCNFKNFY